jgi:hypothetical protein
METIVKQMIKGSLEKRLIGHDDIDNILTNNALIDRWLTCIMALGHNNSDVEAAAQDIFEIQSMIIDISIEDIRARVSQVLCRFGEEVAAFSKYVELRDTADDDTIREAVEEELDWVLEGDFIIA